MQSKLIFLIEEAKNNKQQAQSKLMDLFFEDVKRYIYSITKEEISAEELSILTFTKALSKLSLYNTDFDFKTWLISIAHNTSIDFLRNKSSRKEFLLEEYEYQITDTEPSPEALIIEQQNKENFFKLIKKLPKNYQKIIELRYIEDKKVKEISEELQMTLPNVKVSLMRAKKLLIQFLN